jgi:hypothetical protein
MKRDEESHLESRRVVPWKSVVGGRFQKAGCVEVRTNGSGKWLTVDNSRGFNFLWQKLWLVVCRVSEYTR